MYGSPTTHLPSESAPTCAPRDTLEGVEPMGRGRQKAKATKVARKLKYFSPETDYAALERELVSASSGADPRDEYEELAAKYNVDDDDDWEDSDVPRTEPGRRS